MTAPTNEKLKSFALTLLLAGSILALAGLAYLFLSPKTYQAAARLKIVDWVKSQDLKNPSDEKVAFVQCDLIRSNVVMDPAIENLHLLEIWGKRYHAGTPLSTNEARARLNAVTSVQPLPHSSVIEIRAVSEDADETAKIANAIARSYLDFIQTGRQTLISNKLAGLKQKWDDQNEKIRAAQAEVDKLYFEITRERSTNQTRFYDADAYDLLVAKRAELQAKFISQSNQLADLKKMDHEQLKDVLSSMDSNSVLSATLLRLSKAKSDLFKARLDHPDDSQEVKDAGLVVDKINSQVSGQIDSAMAFRESDVAALQSTLKDADRKIKNASTNVTQVNIQDASYAKALDQLKQLKKDRDDLQKTMDDEESRDAIRPTGVMASLIESAETPSKPFIPDPRLAVGAISVGAIVVLVGFVALLVSQRPKPVRKAPLRNN